MQARYKLTVKGYHAKYIPPFDKSFEQFAADLKKEAEIIYNTKK